MMIEDQSLHFSSSSKHGYSLLTVRPERRPELTERPKSKGFIIQKANNKTLEFIYSFFKQGILPFDFALRSAIFDLRSGRTVIGILPIVYSYLSLTYINLLARKGHQ